MLNNKMRNNNAKKIADCLSSLKVRASQQAVKNMVNCVCPNSNGNPDQSKN